MTAGSCQPTALSESKPPQGDMHDLYELCYGSFVFAGFATLLVTEYETPHGD